MRTVGSYEARTHLARFLNEVERGAEITITRHGIPVARLVPIGERVADRRLAETVEGLKRFRHGRRLGAAALKDLVEDGRRPPP